MRSEVKHTRIHVSQPRTAHRSIAEPEFLTGFVRPSGPVHLCAAAGHLLAQFLPDGQRNGGDGRKLFSPGGPVRLCERLGHPAKRFGPLRNLGAKLFCVGQHSDHLPVGAVVGG